MTKKDDTACPQLATSMYAALTLVKIYKNYKTNYADLERGTKGDIECPRSNKGDIELPSIHLVLSTQRTYTREMAS